jgi:hypothetical protein
VRFADVRQLLVVAIYLGLGWIVGLAIFAVAIWRTFKFLRRLVAALSPATRCPHGHRVEQYGRWRCGCRAVTDGWSWRCRICGAFAGWVACDACGISVSNPLLRR